MSHNVYLVGSVPMADTAEVFQKVSAALGPRIKWLPDGETGNRADSHREVIQAQHCRQQGADDAGKHVCQAFRIELAEIGIKGTREIAF